MWNKIRSFICRRHISYAKRISYCVAIFHSFRKERISLKKKDPLSRVFLFLAPLVGLEPTTCGLTVRRSTDWAKEECLCWRYLSSRAVARQVLSAQMSLTSVFGMGTGGPSSQSIPTRMDGFQPIFYISKAFQLLISLVTHTGFEPMLTAWEAAVLTTWPMGHWCTFTDSNRGPTD